MLCKERDCIILLFDVKHFEDTYLRLLSIIVDSGEFFFEKMGCCFSRKHVNIKVIDNIKNEKRFDYLRPKDELVLSINGIYGVPLISVNFDDWYKK